MFLICVLGAWALFSVVIATEVARAVRETPKAKP